MNGEACKDVALRFWRLYLGYEDDMCLPGQKHLRRQGEFDTKIRELACSYLGHEFGPDQCDKPEHDLCYRCGVRASVLGLRRAENWQTTGRYDEVVQS